MATKPTLPTLTNTGNVQSQLTTINNGYRQIEDEFEKMLSREDNSLPNHMLDALDMDGNKVINVQDGTEGADAVNKSQLDTKEDSLGNPVEDGMFLASLTSGYRYWAKGASGGAAPVPTNEFEYIDFDTTPTVAGDVGRLVWNDTDGTLDLGVKGGNVTLQIGQEQLIRIVNKTGSDMLEANYQCVKISGAQGQRPKVALAQANNDANSADTIGLVTETIQNNLEGFVTTSGIIRGINTTGSLQGESWNDGDVLYLSGTTAGRVTNIKPSAPTHTVIVGFVIYAHNNQGKIYVKVDNGYELDELHNVKITSVANNNVLRYNSTSSVWENIAQTSLAAGTATTLQTTRSINLSNFNGSANITVPRVFALDDRTIAPADGNANYVTAYFTSWANNNTSPYADSLLFRTWGDGSAGNDNLLMLRRDALGMRVWQQTFGSATAFASFKDVAWTDGTNATGTWTVSTTGNAGTVTNGVYTTGNQTIAGDKTFSGTTALASTSTIGGAVIGYRDVPVTISNATYTFALADAGKAFGKDNGTAYTYTIPANGTVAFPVGTVITVFNNNATNNLTIAITTDTLRLAGTTTTGSRTIAPFSLCTLFKVSSTVWMASGAGVT